MRIARSTLIGTAVAMALFGRNNVVQAQTSGDATTSNQNEQLQEVVVTGIRASLEQSIELKRSADSVVDVVTAEDIGKMPDKNIADSLQRVPGVTISSAGANEGGFDENDRVSMRGTNPSLTQTLINGHNVASGDWFVLNQVQHRRSQRQLHAAAFGTGQQGDRAQELRGRPRRRRRCRLRRHHHPQAARLSQAVHTSRLPPAPYTRTCPTRPTRSSARWCNWKNERCQLRRHAAGVLREAPSAPRRRRAPRLRHHRSPAAPWRPRIRIWPGVQYPTDIGAAFFTQERKRTGGLIDFEFKPTDNLDLDLSGFFSKLEGAELQPQLPAVEHALHQLRRRPGARTPGYVVKNNTLTKATFTGVPGTLYGVYDQISRPDEEATTNFVNLDGNCRSASAVAVRRRSAPPRATARRRRRTSRRPIRAPARARSGQLNGLGAAPNFGFLGNYQQHHAVSRRRAGRLRLDLRRAEHRRRRQGNLGQDRQRLPDATTAPGRT